MLRINQMIKMKKALKEEKGIQKILLIIIQREDKTRQDKRRNKKSLENKESLNMNRHLQAIV